MKNPTTAREKITNLAGMFLEEFKTIATHDELEFILNNGAMDDATLPFLSVEMIVMLGEIIITDRDLLEELDDIETDIESNARKLIASKIKSTKPETMKNIAINRATILIRRSYLYPDKPVQRRRHELEIFVQTFRRPATSIERAVSLKIIELLVSRSLFHNDNELLDSLVCANREIGGGGYKNSSQVRQIISYLIEFNDYLKMKLGSAPSKEELKDFVLTFDPKISSDHKLWSKARIDSGLYDSYLDRSIARDPKRKRLVLSLARKLSIEFNSDT